jgi:endonuclease-3 related protein
MYYTRWDGQYCEFIAVGDERGLSNLHMNTGEGKRTFALDESWIRNDAFFEDVKEQIMEYERGDRREFSLDLNPAGTDYQKKVWKALSRIPYGDLVTYKDIAKAIGNEKASRAVGAANGKNPIPLIVPCHRVVGANGKLTGFAHGLRIKEDLILHEKANRIYQTLMAAYGPRGWWPAASDLEMMIGAILVQNTNWANVDLALKNLNHDLTPEGLAALSEAELEDRIRPSGFFRQKAKTIRAFLAWFKGYGYEVDRVKMRQAQDLRRELLGIRGIGHETADCILVYAFDKPFFVADAYARRIIGRVGLAVPEGYEAFRKKMERSLVKDLKVYNEFHALLVEVGKEHCSPKPKCGGCSLEYLCEFAAKNSE